MGRVYGKQDKLAIIYTEVQVFFFYRRTVERFAAQSPYTYIRFYYDLRYLRKY